MEGKIGKMKSSSEAGFQEISLKVKVFSHTPPSQSHCFSEGTTSWRPVYSGNFRIWGRMQIPFLALALMTLKGAEVESTQSKAAAYSRPETGLCTPQITALLTSHATEEAISLKTRPYLFVSCRVFFFPSSNMARTIPTSR